MIIAVISMACLSSCTPEPDGAEETRNVFDSVNLRLSSDLSKDFFESFDVVAIVKFDGEELMNEVVSDSIWSYEFKLTDIKVSSISCEMVAKPKKELPEYDANKVYTMSHDAFGILKVIKKGVELNPMFNGMINYDSKSVKGDKAKDFVTKRESINLMSISYDLSDY